MNDVKVKGHREGGKWWWTAECRRCGPYRGIFAKSLFPLLIRRADAHARHGTAHEDWGPKG